MILTLVVATTLLAACGEDDATSPEPQLVPASIQKMAGTDSQSVTVGTMLPINPSVKVLSADGRPIRGAAVTFTMSEGNGTITGATPVTDAGGIATLGSWRVGTKSGQNGLTVSVGALPTYVFHAFGRPGPAAAFLKTESSDNNAAFVGHILYPPPEVRVVDAYGNGISGAAVSFTVTSGGGSLIRSIPPTNSDGYTGALGWRLGDTPGINTLRASMVGMPSADFTATAVARCRAVAMTPETTVAGELSTTDCTQGLFYYDHYSLSLTQTGAMRFDLTSTAFDAYLLLYDDAGFAIAGSDDYESGTTNARIKAILPQQRFEASVSSYDFEETGPYQFSARATAASIENCEEVWVTPGIVTAQSIKGTDCHGDYGEPFDFVLIVLREGVPVTIGMQSTDWTTYIAVYGPGGRLGESETGSFTFTPQTNAVYAILASSASSQPGNYTLSITAEARSASIASTLVVPRGEQAAPSMITAVPRGEKATAGPVQALREMVQSPSAMRDRKAARERANARRTMAQP